MPKLNFKRLMVEFKQVESAIAAGQVPSFHRCAPVEDNLMEWEVDISFPADSALQKSLENLAASMFDSSLNKLTLCIRFPVEFPMSPPEAWLRRPRMRYRSGQSGPVTFGGRVCSMLLASAGWQPATSMLAVLKEVQQSLVDSGIEANTTVCVKKDSGCQCLNTELFPTVNGFCKDGMTAISPVEASAFLGDLSRLEATDKIGLPFAYANSIYQRAELGAELVLPMVFELKTLLGRKTHCAIFEFVDGLPDMHVLIPKWVMEDLAIDEREPVRVRGVSLDLVTAVKVQPHSVDFYSAVRDSGRDVRELLTESLSRFSTLTEDTAVPIEVSGKLFEVQVITVEPHGAVRIIDMDVQHHFEFKVEFEPAPDLEDEAATKEFQDRALKSLKLRRERSAAGRQEIEDRRREAREKRYEDLVSNASAKATADSSEGTLEIGLRMPDGSQVKGKFSEGAPVACLALAALQSTWAKAALPWNIYLRMAFPKKVLGKDDIISKDFHRTTLSVQEEQAPDKDEELFAVLRDSPSPRKSVGASGIPEELAPPPVPERDESELLARTQRAFEMQRFLRAGFSLEEAEKKFQAGEILPPTAASRRPEPRPPAALGSVSKPASPVDEAEEDEKEKRIEAVVAFTGADRDAAKRALEENQWIEELAVNSEAFQSPRSGLARSAVYSPDFVNLLAVAMSMYRYKNLQSAVANGQVPGLVRCEPVDDNMLDWDIDMAFPPESRLQQSLDSLADSMFDPEMKKLTLGVRFPAEYPLSPPEVWLRAALASGGWNPVTTMIAVLQDVRQALIDSGIEAYTTVAIKKEYPKAQVQLVRLHSELFPTVNGFCKENMTVLSAREAAPFLGDLSRLEATDKIGLPFSYANEIYSREDLRLPLIFEVTTRLGRKTHCAIFEFVNGLPDMHVLMPKWVMNDLCIDERESVRVRGVELDLITSVKVQPHSVDFYEAVKGSGREVQSLLTDSLARFSALTEDTAVPIDVDGTYLHVQIVSVAPRGAVRIIDTDVQHHFEFKVDFVPAPDLEDEAAKQEHQRRVIDALKLKRDQSALKKQELTDRLQAARQHRFRMLLADATKAAGGGEGGSKGIEIALRLPDGSQVKGAYEEGSPIACLLLAALDSDWAKSTLPWGIYLRMAFPKKVLKEGDLITKEFHRSMLSVQEEEAPDDEQILAVLSEAAAPSGTKEDPEALSPEPMPELDEEALMARTQKAFEVQRLVRAGCSQQEAEDRYSKGDILPPTDASRRPEPLPPAGPAAPVAPVRLERTLSQEEERQRKIQVVMNFTGVDIDVAQVALEDAGWTTDRAINTLLDNLAA
ncbi:ufd1 [Symbiodinium pilosum]|uniref:Ufd1 protein n=1 Tax=Symbiodinium pilosum TaxID=2952 RepID=A0A812YKI3_SYMPI|nr:ufd1 [Symbiodinium pilosum]